MSLLKKSRVSKWMLRYAAGILLKQIFYADLYYFDLVRAWGGVPLVTALNPPIKLNAASRDEVYTQIENDLLAAINDLT